MTPDRLHPRSKPDLTPMDRIDLAALAVLFVCVVSLVLGFITISTYGSTPLILIPGMVVGAIAITKLRK